MFQSQFLVGLGLALFANSGVKGARIEVAALNINAQPAPLPSIEVYEIKRENVNSLNYMINDRRSLQLVNTSRNSDLLFGEETASDSALLLKCHAPYSVQWIFRGDSDPEFNTNTSTTEAHGSYSYNAYLFLGSRRNLNERETGKYICTSVRSKRMQSYVYIFVTRAALFTNKGLETIQYSKNDDSVRVPCSLSEPRAIATLQKSQEGILKCPMNDSVSFDPKQGFLLNLRRIEQPQGTYLCIADYNNTFQIIKYNVVQQAGLNGTQPDQTSEEDNEPSASESPVGSNGSSPSPINCANAKLKCGHNAGCVINNKGDAVCRCEEDFVGNPYVECKHISQTTSAPPPPQQPGEGEGPADEFPSEFCSSDKECPYDRACIHNTCQDPCTVKSICGPNTICNDTENHIPSCHCLDHFVGDPYSSQQGQQCEATRCEPNPCGENTNCKHVSDNVISCSCKPGYTRHHDGICRPSKKGSPVQIIHYPPRTRPSSPAGISSGGPTNKVKECHYDTDCADDRMCVQDKCDDPCVNACGQNAICHTRNHFPRCVCPVGTNGDPFYKCSPLFSEIISASSGSSSSSASPPPKPPKTNVIPSESDEVVDCGGRNTPCGPNSICQATKRYFVCACPNFFVGDPYSKVGCARENGYHKCRNDADCPHFLACLRFEGCVNPCNVKNVCQRGRSCVPYLHRPACLKTANFDEERPRDDLPDNLETNEELEITDVPVGLNGTSCFVKSADNKLISPCGRNSFCVDIDGQPFCGCTVNTVGDPYTGCEPLQSCKNESTCGAKETCEDGFCREKLGEDITVSSTASNNSNNPCSPSPCADPLEQCVIIRSNNSALCIPARDNLTAIEMSDLPSSENLLRSGLCLEGNCEDYLDDEAESGSTTEIAYITVVPSTGSYLPSSSSVSVEEKRSLRERVELPTSNESRQLMREELSVVDA